MKKLKMLKKIRHQRNSIAYIALGSNIDPSANLQKAIEFLQQQKELVVEKISKFYTTKPWGYLEQDDFVNAAIKISTKLSPFALLSFLQDIENMFGRTRNGKQYGPRTLDLDIIFYNQRIIRTKKLCIPHPHAGRREFVLLPLRDVCGKKMIQSIKA